MKHINIIFLLFFALSLKSCIPILFAGTTTSIVSVSGDRSAGQAFDDTKIVSTIKLKLLKDNFKTIYAKVNVNVLHGRVLYTGSVVSQEDILKAIEVAWATKGVVEVVSEITVNEDGKSNFTFEQYTRDSMITAQIQSKAFLKRTIKLVNYTIVTVNDVVYIFGQAKSQEEIDELAEIASKTRCVKKVVTHVKIIDGDENH